jgi:hypothetical protein
MSAMTKNRNIFFFNFIPLFSNLHNRSK